MSSTASRASGSRREKPGLRTPIAGYQGHVPGMTSLNLHGAPWRELVLQDPLLHPQTSRPNSAWQPHPRTSRPASACQPFSRARGDEAREARGNVQLRPASAAQSDRIARFQESRRMSAEMSGMHWDEFERPAFDAGAKENNYMPRMDNNWKPPIVGYGGHVPGYTSGNMHGSAWKDLLMPTRDHSAAPTRKATPQLGARPMLSDDGECTSTAGHAQPAPRSLPLPNNIAGYIKTPRSRPSSARTPRPAFR